MHARVIWPDPCDPRLPKVLKGLAAAEKCFGCKTNGKGYKVITGAAVIQGDGINYEVIRKILDAVLKDGYSVENVAFGMGGGLLQKVNRDTMSFATKLSSITYANGEQRDVMKTPKSSAAKTSLPGKLFVGRAGPTDAPMVYPHGDPATKSLENCMVVVYNKRPVPGVFEDFDQVRARVDREWKALAPGGKPVSPQLQNKIDDILRSRGWSV